MTYTYRSLEDKVILISGGASGIGEEFVRAFAANGAKVAFLDVQEDAARALIGYLAGAKHTPLFLPCDVTKTDELKAVIEDARKQLGPTNVLVNNAANDQRQVFEKVTPEELDRTMAVIAGPHRIRVNAVAPGLVLTEKQLRLWYPTPEKVAQMVGNQFLPDGIQPAEVARLALFLASDDSRMITKQTFALNGGRP